MPEFANMSEVKLCNNPLCHLDLLYLITDIHFNCYHAFTCSRHCQKGMFYSFSQTEEDDDATGLGQFAALNHEDITELFHLCDADSSGYIEKAELGSIVPQIDNLTLERLMQELDCDGDGRISLAELESGLHKLTNPELLQGSETNNNNGHMDQPNNKFYRSRR